MGSRLASALSFSHVDVGDAFQFINHIIAERRKIQQVGALCLFHTSIYQSFIGGLPPASALSFSHVDVGDAFQFINHISLLYTLYRIEKKCVSIALARATRKLVGFHMK